MSIHVLKKCDLFRNVRVKFNVQYIVAHSTLVVLHCWTQS